jgi:hypothetical protein
MSQHTARAMHPLCGHVGNLHLNGSDYRWTLPVVVLDVRNRFGSLDYLARPFADANAEPTWVSADRVTDLAAPTAVTVTLPLDVAREVAQAVTYRADYLDLRDGDNTDEERAEADRLGEALGVLAAAGVSTDVPFRGVYSLDNGPHRV